MNPALVRLLERPTVYRAWQRPFVSSKLAPLAAHNDLSRVRRVLDVGCGPGTNSQQFQNVDYLGVDVNPAYIDYARRRYKGTFVVADVRHDSFDGAGSYDFVLLNSLLHHLDDTEANGVLGSLRPRLSADGHVHVVELIVPDEAGLPRLLAHLDRGEHPRSLVAWRELLGRHYDEVVLEPFAVPARGPSFWSMVYFKGRPR